MSPSTIWAVVPLKPFKTAKRRIATALTPAERLQLARLMAEDVIDALGGARHLLAGIMVVTADGEAAAIARRCGAVVVTEPMPAGVNSAVARALDHLSEDGNRGLIVVPADLPQITADHVAAIARHLAAPRAVALVPASRDGGTNVLSMRPAGIIRPRFGPDSFARHQAAARAAGITPVILASPDLGCDIDRPDDLEAFLSLRSATRTHSFLASRVSQRHAHHSIETAVLRPNP